MRFIHTADLHIGFRQYGLESRKEAFTAAFRTVVNHALITKPDVAVIAGDIFEKDIRTTTLEELVQSEVIRLREAGIAVLGVEGNHDFVGDDSTLRICGITPLNGQVVHVKHVTFTGINFCGRKGAGGLKEKLAAIPAADVLVMHQMVNDFCKIGGDIFAQEIVDLVKAKGIRYVAMGDAHGHWMTELDRVTAAYPGSLEMTDIDEPREKMFLEVEIGENPKLPYLQIKQIELPCQPIIRAVLNTEEECEALIAQAKAQPGALYYLSVARDLSRMIGRIEGQLRSRNIAVTIKSHSKEAAVGGRVDIKPFERANSNLSLLAVTDEVLGAGTVEAALAREIAEQPQRLVELCNNFLKEKLA